MSNSFISWLGLMNNAYMRSHELKLSTIWFSEIVSQVPRPEIAGKIVDVICERDGISTATEVELRKIFVPIQSKIEDYKFLDSEPWSYENRELVKAAHDATAAETIQRYPHLTEDSPGLRHEVAWAGAGLIEGIVLWSMLNKSEATSFLSHRRESKVIQSVFSASEKKDPSELFSACAEKRIPNIQQLSWDKVIELRNNPFMEKFRRKITELQKGIGSKDTALFLELIDEIERKDMVEFIRLTKPSSKSMSLIKLISSNIPLPIPINPVSIGLGISEYTKGKEILDKYGWLYFMFELAGE